VKYRYGCLRCAHPGCTVTKSAARPNVPVLRQDFFDHLAMDIG
jgi:hypothetical protein